MGEQTSKQISSPAEAQRRTGVPSVLPGGSRSVSLQAFYLSSYLYHSSWQLGKCVFKARKQYGTDDYTSARSNNSLNQRLADAHLPVQGKKKQTAANQRTHSQQHTVWSRRALLRSAAGGGQEYQAFELG